MRYRHLNLAVLVLTAGLAGCASNLSSLSLEGHGIAPPDDTPVSARDPEIAGRERVPVDGVPYSIATADPARAAQILSLRGTTRAAASGTRSIAAAPDTTPTTKKNLFDVVTVLWGTDRKIETRVIGEAPPQPATGPLVTSSVSVGRITYATPTTERGSKLTTGAAIVTIPRTARQTGTIPRPRQYTFLDPRYYRETESPAKHFTIASLRVLDPAELVDRANGLVDKSRRFKDQALVFVHGYNTSFDDALFRTAQIAHDLEFDGLAAMYSWPSRGTYLDYSYDLNSAARSQSYLIAFLERIARETRAKRIHIVAHSMGNRPLIEALRTLEQSGSRDVRAKIGQVVFAAPDVDRDLFSEITSKLEIGLGRTLYASNEDKALILSRQADGVPRAGDVPPGGPVILKGLDTIDISSASTKALLATNHSNYAERSHILKDIQLLIDTGTRPPNARFPLYQIAEARGGRYWRYVPNQ